MRFKTTVRQLKEYLTTITDDDAILVIGHEDHSYYDVGLPTINQAEIHHGQLLEYFDVECMSDHNNKIVTVLVFE